MVDTQSKHLTIYNLQSDTQGAEMLLLEDYIFKS